MRYFLITGIFGLVLFRGFCCWSLLCRHAVQPSPFLLEQTKLPMVTRLVTRSV